MRLVSRFLLAMLGLPACSMLCQQTVKLPNASSQTKPAKVVQGPPVVPQTPQEVSLLFSGASANERILLTLNNNHVTDLVVTATVFSPSGQETSLPPFLLVGRESRLVELTDILQTAGLGTQELGWLKLNYTGVFLGMGAQLTLYDSNTRSGIDSPRSLSKDFKSQGRHAAFWMPQRGEARISLTNSSVDSISAQLTCGLVNRAITIAGHGTSIQKMSKVDLDGPLALVEGASSCDINSDGKVSALRVTGTVRNDHGYAAPIRFYDASTATYPSLTAVGVVTSSQTHIAVHNLTNLPIIVSPLVTESTLNEPKKIATPSRVLPPHGTVSIDLSHELRELETLGISNATITLQSNAPNGSYVGSLTQEAESNGLIEDIPLRTAPKAGNAAGAYPLRWDKDYTNLITVTNTSSLTLTARSVITVGGVSYMPEPRVIEPGRTAVYDVDKMRSSQEKDFRGHVIPLGSTFGKFMWVDSSLGSKAGLMGRNSVTSVFDRRKSSFSCNMDCGFTFEKRPVFDVDPFAYGPYGSSWIGNIVDRAFLSNGQEVTSPYAFSNTQLASSNSSVLSYGVGPYSSSSYIATTGVGGAVQASYYDYDSQEAYDEFDDCDPLFTEGQVNGSGGTYPTITITGQPDVLRRVHTI